MSNERKISAYTLKQAEQVNGKFVKSDSRVVRPLVKVFEDVAETHNANFEATGSYYEKIATKKAETKKPKASKKKSKK